jgi:DNA-binding response OmpR family regulator
LAIAKKYSEMLGGSIEVKSKPGKGSVFLIRLPLKPLHISDFSTDEGSFEPESAEHIYSARQQTIMIIEDSEAAIIQVSDILSEAGYNIIVARNGNQAIEQISVSVPDAIVLDLMMPGTDGFETLTCIRNMHEAMGVPVIILTAKHVTAEELSALKKNNIMQLIQKGAIRKEELLAAVRRMFSKKKESDASNKAINTPKLRPAILIIEDNPDNMMGLKAILKDRYEIYEATEGNMGVKVAINQLPDLILLDISLPDMDGFAVFDELKKTNKANTIPVIALTARALNEDRDTLLKYGFDGFIPKPVDIDKLNETINKFLSISKNDHTGN